ncbi:MAG: MlaC/ttg2D family ABC transporter substrate-binding protein [Parvibaculales bacterium]
MSKFLTILALFLAPAISPAFAEEADMASAKQFVTDLADEAIVILRNAENRAAREEGFHSLLTERANLRRIARFTLGQFARQVEKDEFEAFQTLLTEMIVKVYANRLAEYSDEKVIVDNVQNKKRNFIVASHIEFANGRDPIEMSWWLVKEKSGAFSLFDVNVLGVWMAQEQRDSYASVLKKNRGDMSKLLSHMRNQLNADTQDTMAEAN